MKYTAIIKLDHPVIQICLLLLTQMPIVVGVGLCQGCHFLRSCLWCSWTKSQGAAVVRRVSSLGTSELCPSFLQMTWFSWLLLSVTSSRHWGGLQLSVKRSGWQSASPSLRQWFPAGKREIVPSPWSLALRSYQNLRLMGRCPFVHQSSSAKCSEIL